MDPNIIIGNSHTNRPWNIMYKCNYIYLYSAAKY